MRGATSAVPEVVPITDSAIPTAIRPAPTGPRKASAASLMGASDPARWGWVPRAVAKTATYSAPTTTTTPAIARGTARLGSAVSPAGTAICSNPENAQSTSSVASPRRAVPDGANGTKRSGSTCHAPTARNRASGTSLAAVSSRTIRAPARTPTTFAAASSAIAATATPGSTARPPDRGQRGPRGPARTRWRAPPPRSGARSTTSSPPRSPRTGRRPPPRTGRRPRSLRTARPLRRSTARPAR